MKKIKLIILLSLITNSVFSQTQQEVVNYFNSICRKSEYNDDGSGGLIKWNKDIFIYVKGQKIDYLMSELQSIINELNQIIDPIHIRITNDELKSNFTVFFGSHDDYKKILKNNDDLIDDNWGLGAIYGNPNITHATIYVDIYRAESVEAQKHLLREELTQCLGLTNDTYDYPESIFYQGWTETNQYADIDIKLIKMLYNN